MIDIWLNKETDISHPGLLQKVSLMTAVTRRRPEGSLFNSYNTEVLGRALLFCSELLHFTLDPYLITLSVKQGDIKYYFLSFWYDVTRDWTPVSRVIGEHSIN